MNETILKVEGLKKYFPIKGGVFQTTVGNVKAVDGVSFEIKKGETLGLVGESGCGKSTTGRTILRLLEKTEGSVIYKGTDIHELKKKELRNLRTDMQIVFQDPYSSLNPRMSIGEIISEAVIHHGIVSKKDARDLTLETMRICGLSDYQIDRYPHEFSGGQRQRIGIARALCVNPELVICDESVSALDVSIQAQVLNLLKKIKEERNLTYIFITHDLSVVEYISDRIAVMYLGRIVELAETSQIFSNNLHPYTEALLSAIPIADLDHKRKRIVLEGDVPSPVNPPEGCNFHPRCRKCMDICKKERPLLKKHIVDGEEHYVACHLAEMNIKENNNE